MNTIRSQMEACTLMKLFEIPVVDTRTQRATYIIFDIELKGDTFVASHESLNKQQEESKFISAVTLQVDPDFSLDENLQSLYDACIDAILSSDFFTLREE